jgi:hypothetical protein
VEAKASLLETLALAQLDRDALIAKLAMLWRRENAHRDIIAGKQEAITDLQTWVLSRWGPLFPAAKAVRWARRLYYEVQRQQLVAQRRRCHTIFTDPLEDATIGTRRGRLLDRILGPPTNFIPGKQLGDENIYFCGTISLTFVAGLVSTRAATPRQRGRNRLFVYRVAGHDPQAYWVHPAMNQIRGTIEWLGGSTVYRARKAGARVIFDGDQPVFRLTYPDGRRTRVRWRKLVDYS